MLARNQLRHKKMTGRFMSVKRPVTFSEKLHWRQKYDRRLILAPTCDKLWMKEYALRAPQDLRLKLPSTYWAGPALADAMAVLADLPPAWVLKPTDGMNAQVFFGDPRVTPDVLDRLARQWTSMRRRSAFRGRPWAYRQARQGYLIEERIDSYGGSLADIKVHTFGGEPALIQFIDNRWNSSGATQVLLSPAWTVVENSLEIEPGPVPPRPTRLQALLEIASALGSPFDYMRVDLYQRGEDIYFGELTPYPNPGRFPADRALDDYLGARWTLPEA
jgi:hypothetical protein